MKIVKLLPWHEAEDKMLGFTFDQAYEDVLVEYIKEHNIRRGGDWHQDNVPLFDDGNTIAYSMRAWGGLLADIWSEVDGKDYNYMDFYMDSVLGCEANPPI